MSTAELRRAACKKVTALMQQEPEFSFLRMGDGELAFMLNVQQGRSNARRELKAGVEEAYDGPGITNTHYDRVRTSYEECTYLDRHDNLAFNAENIPKLEWQRHGPYGNETPDTAMLIYDWTYQEFHDYVRGRRCLFAGAEAALLRELFYEPSYRQLYAKFWPADAQPIFHQVRGDGEDLSKHLDFIKADLKEIIQAEKIDTLFLCLGGAAKPICYELAKELKIRAIDFGSMMRGLGYCGSSGASLWRSSHHPFFVRIPFALHMGALEVAQPGLSPTTLLAKAHAQLCLDLQRKEAGVSFAADAIDPTSFDPSPENRRAFDEGLEVYRQKYRPLAAGHPEAEALVKEFDRWCLKKGIGWKGQAFLALVKARQALRRMLGRS